MTRCRAVAGVDLHSTTELVAGRILRAQDVGDNQVPFKAEGQRASSYGAADTSHCGQLVEESNATHPRTLLATALILDFNNDTVRGSCVMCPSYCVTSRAILTSDSHSLGFCMTLTCYHYTQRRTKAPMFAVVIVGATLAVHSKGSTGHNIEERTKWIGLTDPGETNYTINDAGWIVRSNGPWFGNRFVSNTHEVTLTTLSLCTIFPLQQPPLWQPQRSTRARRRPPFLAVRSRCRNSCPNSGGSPPRQHNPLVARVINRVLVRISCWCLLVDRDTDRQRPFIDQLDRCTAR